MAADSIILNSDDPGHMKVGAGYLKSFAGRGNIRLEVTVLRGQRSLSQNAWWHGVVFPHIAKCLSDAWGRNVTMDEAKQTMKDMFLRREHVNAKTGEATNTFYTKGTHELDVEEGIWFSERMLEFA